MPTAVMAYGRYDVASCAWIEMTVSLLIAIATVTGRLQKAYADFGS